MSPRLEAIGLRKLYPSGDGVTEASVTVEAGEIHALVGLNGAGKSTLMRLVLGMLRPDSGYVSIDGTVINGTSIAGTSSTSAPPGLWRGVGHLVEYPLAYPELTVRQNLALAARLHGLASTRVSEAVEAVIAELALEPYADRRARALSLGNRQRLGIGSALQHDPALIVLDEPSNALDPAGVLLVRESLVRRARAGAGILVSSHHLDEVARVADRITVMNAGRLIGSLDPHTIDIERAFFTLVHEDSARHAEHEGHVKP